MRYRLERDLRGARDPRPRPRRLRAPPRARRGCAARPRPGRSPQARGCSTTRSRRRQAPRRPPPTSTRGGPPRRRRPRPGCAWRSCAASPPRPTRQLAALPAARTAAARRALAGYQAARRRDGGRRREAAARAGGRRQRARRRRRVPRDAANPTPYFAVRPSASTSARCSSATATRGRRPDAAGCSPRGRGDTLAVDATIDRIRATIEIEPSAPPTPTRSSPTSTASSPQLARVAGEDTRRYRQTVWFETSRPAADQAYLAAHLASLHEVIGGAIVRGLLVMTSLLVACRTPSLEAATRRGPAIAVAPVAPARCASPRARSRACGCARRPCALSPAPRRATRPRCASRSTARAPGGARSRRASSGASSASSCARRTAATWST